MTLQPSHENIVQVINKIMYDYYPGVPMNSRREYAEQILQAIYQDLLELAVNIPQSVPGLGSAGINVKAIPIETLAQYCGVEVKE